MRLFWISLFVLVFTACSPLVPVTDLTKVPPSDVAESMNIKVYTIDSSAQHPPITQVLGNVTAYSCKFLPTDPPASKGDALKRLRLEALKLHANAVVDVTFDTRGTDAFGTNCWESVQANGQAVLLRADNVK
jgi:uncharacterized protein YbjQ (UPF0145 family)